MANQRTFHRLLGPLFLLLLLSGAGLYNEALRNQLADWRVGLRWLHIVAGVLFGITFLVNLPYFWQHRHGTGSGPNRWGFLLALFSAGLIWIVSGMGLIAGGPLSGGGTDTDVLRKTHVIVAAAGIWIVLPHLLHGTRRK